MNKRVLAVLLAVLLAVVGVGFVLLYAQNADERALGDAELVTVVQATTAVDAGATPDDLKASVIKVKLPKVAVVKGAIDDLSDVAGLASTVDLQPGEQLLASRFAKNGLAVGKTDATVPRGMQEVTINLTTDRVVGGIIVPGDTVGVARSFGSLTIFDLHKVLVTRIAAVGAVATEAGAEAAPAAVASYYVTVAVDTAQAAAVINAVESGKVYLTKQNEFSATPAVTVETPTDG